MDAHGEAVKVVLGVCGLKELSVCHRPHREYAGSRKRSSESGGWAEAGYLVGPQSNSELKLDSLVALFVMDWGSFSSDGKEEEEEGGVL